MRPRIKRKWDKEKESERKDNSKNCVGEAEGE